MKNNTSGSEVYAPKDKKGLGLRTGLIIIVIGLLLIGVVAIALNGTVLGSAEQPSKHYEGFFLDVNGDGYMDYVKSMDVIVNSGGAIPQAGEEVTPNP